MRAVTDRTALLVHMVKATGKQQAVTIRYVKANGEVSRRRIEIHQIRVDSKGAILLDSMDHRSRELRSFRLDRITHFTLHRSSRLAGYSWPVYAEATDDLDEDGDIAGCRTWTLAYTLAA